MSKTKSKIYNSVEEVFEDNTTPSEREYAKKFKKVYSGVRKSLVFINKNRTEKGNEWAMNEAYKTLEKGLHLLQ